MIRTIEFQNVSKSYKSKYRVLSDLSFSCLSNETYFLFGHTGSGKSTIFDLLLKDVKPNSGKVLVYDTDLFKLNKKKTNLYLSQLGIIWQSLLLVDQKTVFENIALPLILKSEKRKIIKQKVDQILKDANLYGVRDEFPATLTLSQKKMVVILRALVIQPKILIADEPMNHLDTEYEDVTMELINKYKHPDATVLIATNQTYIIEKFHDQANVWFLENGKIVADLKVKN